MSSSELIVLIDSHVAGRVQRARRGQMEFTYVPAWREAEHAVPLSLSMPLAGGTYGHRAIEPFLWGLLPDNAFVLDRWGRRFQVSPRSAFALLAHVGEDCAGAVQLIRPERLDAVQGPGQEDVTWLREEDIADRLRMLRQDQGAWRTAADTGQFSLAGAQPKTAFLVRDGRYGVPAGRTPTTHILKPPIRDLLGHVENEHLCLSLAAALGLPSAQSKVRRFGEETAIEVARFDRIVSERGAIRRVHQEDLCQALGVHPTSKYQNAGGPTPEQITTLLREASTARNEDVATFADALAYNWLIAGTDAHAKNYAVLHSSRGVRLAPLYDIATILPYAVLDAHKVKFAMKIGGRYRLKDIARPQWERLADGLGLDTAAFIERIVEMADRIPDAAGAIAGRMVDEGVKPPLPIHLATLVASRATACAQVLRS